jgi:hypothetical protein
MGTAAFLFKRNDFIPVAEQSAAQGSSHENNQRGSSNEQPRDNFQLRAFPNDDVFWPCKEIDNSRLVRMADPAAKGQCWSSIAATCALAVIIATANAPRLLTRLDGYELQKLKAERATLLEEKKLLAIEKAKVLNPVNMGELAARQKLLSPVNGQVVHLQPKDGGVASIVKPSPSTAR